MKKIIYIVIIILLIGVLLISSYFIFKNNKEDKEQEELYEQIVEIAQDNKKDEENQEDNIDMQSLYKLNNDIIAWLKIEDTQINYPVMQTKDRPNYYLRKDFYKNYSIWGTPYLAENCDIKNSENLIIYGHHIKNNKMFGELENYKRKDYYENHKIIKLYTLEEESKYEIISVFKTAVYNSKGFRYYEYTNFKNEEQFYTFVNECKRLSFFDTKQEVKLGDKFLTLSTCEYSQKNGRLVIVARKIL